ncbi:MAG: glucosaminidase domain-containing protein [Alphaproteobacteria bacterium]
MRHLLRANLRDRAILTTGVCAILVAGSILLSAPAAVGIVGGTLKSSATLNGAMFVRDVRGADALSDLYAQMDYHLQDVREGLIDVPRILLRQIPDDLATVESATARKALFFRTLLPLMLDANEAVLRDRARLIALEQRLAAGETISSREQAWLERLTQRYEVDGVNFQQLLRRVDAVPPSLAMAQAAIESGWGTSRFAREGQALFGQKVFNPDAGMTPASGDEDDYQIRAFNGLAEGVRAYVYNLNTHNAYREFRDRRAGLRVQNRPLDGYELAATISKYSERGPDYIRDVRAMIQSNQLRAFDGARLERRSPLASTRGA